MDLLHILHRMHELPPGEVWRRGWAHAARKAAEVRQRRRDRHHATYGRAEGRLAALAIDADVAGAWNEDLAGAGLGELAERFCAHEFDLLGSGWVRVRHGMRCAGCAGSRYERTLAGTEACDGRAPSADVLLADVPTPARAEARRLLSLLQEGDAGYVPIDWQRDFKSGWRWSARCWSEDLAYGDRAGADVKVPWELARMEHLPLLALAYGAARTAGDAARAERYAREYRSEVLDFSAQNPPRYGANWRCTMDVGIRIANWLLAYDLFTAAGASWDAAFVDALTAAVWDHGRHIVTHLEYWPHLRSNHYLSDLVGLLSAALHLEGRTADRWLAFAVQELAGEMRHEFHEDGSNFEASTSYHCLSTELMLYGAVLATRMDGARRARLGDAALYCGLPRLRPLATQAADVRKAEIFPAWFWERLDRALRFVAQIADEQGEIPFIGDQDSGRLCKLAPVYGAPPAARMAGDAAGQKIIAGDAGLGGPEENLRQQAHLVRARAVLFAGVAPVDAEGALLAAWRGHVPRIAPTDADVLVTADGTPELPAHAGAREETYRFGADAAADSRPADAAPSRTFLDGLRTCHYPGMGIVIFDSPRLHLVVRCGEVGQNGNGGHGHNDQMSLSLRIDGRDVIVDPGSYLYTPAPAWRNRFRATAAHFTPQAAGREQNDWEPGRAGLFSIRPDRAHGEILAVTRTAVLMTHAGFGAPVYRRVTVTPDAVVVEDRGAGITRWRPFPYRSDGYGKIAQHS